MKKIIAAAAVLIATVAGAFAWTNNIGVGFTVPISQFKAKTTSASDIKEIGYGLNAFYMGYTGSGFTVKTAIDAAVATSKDVSVQKDDTNIGTISDFSIGLGWTFVKTDNLTLSLLGMFGMDVSTYYDEDEDVTINKNGTNVKYKYVDKSVTNLMFDVGGDVYVSYKLMEHFGIFANVAVRYVIGGVSTNSYEEAKEESSTETTVTRISYDNKYNGGFRISPTVGVCWRL